MQPWSLPMNGPATRGEPGRGDEVDAVAELMKMGFDRQDVLYALRQARDDTSLAATILFEGAEEEMEEARRRKTRTAAWREAENGRIAQIQADGVRAKPSAAQAPRRAYSPHPMPDGYMVGDRVVSVVEIVDHGQRVATADTVGTVAGGCEWLPGCLLVDFGQHRGKVYVRVTPLHEAQVRHLHGSDEEARAEKARAADRARAASSGLAKLEVL